MIRSRIFVSPNVGQDLPIEKSVKSLTGGEQARFRSLARDLIGDLGSTHNSVGAWVDGSEPVVAALANTDPKTARKIAARLGKAAHQKAVLVFHEHEDGPQVIHDVQVHGTDVPAIHKSLLAHGINQHTITPGQHSTVVSVYDQDGSQTQPVATFTRAAHGHHTQTKGTGEFLGDPNWSSRQRAGLEYDKLGFQGLVKKARTNEPHPTVHGHARDYMAKAGLPFDESPLDYAPLDKGVAQQTAAFYDKAPHSPHDPEVQKAYSAFKKETLGQYNHLRSRGVKLEPWIKEGQPYQNSQEMVNDVHGNNHLHYFVGGDMPKDHPLAEHTGLVENGHPITYNDAFRAVHDYYGHAAYGNEFGPRGEEHAWRAHKRMYSPEAQPAMTFETKGQNSWVNFGPHSHLPVTQRPFAEQKANLLKLARRAVERVKKAAGGFHDWPAMVEHWVGQSGLHGKTLGILGDYLEENGNPNHVALRSPQGLYDHYTDWYWKKYPRGLDWDEETRQYVPTTVDLTRGQIASRKKWQSDAIKPQLERLWGSGMSSYAKPSAGAGSFTEFLHELPNHQQSPPPPPKTKRTKKARPIETPEDREHREAEEALSSGQAPSAALIGQLKPGTKKEIGGKQYLRSMDGPHELTEVDPKSFGYRPQKYRNQAIIDKYRAQIQAAIKAGKTPLEAVEPVQGEPFQREDINEGKPTNYLRDGNHRTDAAIAEGLEKIPAWFPMKMSRIKKLLARLRRSRSLPSRPTPKYRPEDFLAEDRREIDLIRKERAVSEALPTNQDSLERFAAKKLGAILPTNGRIKAAHDVAVYHPQASGYMMGVVDTKYLGGKYGRPAGSYHERFKQKFIANHLGIPEFHLSYRPKHPLPWQVGTQSAPGARREISFSPRHGGKQFATHDEAMAHIQAESMKNNHLASHDEYKAAEALAQDHWNKAMDALHKIAEFKKPSPHD